MAQKQEIQFTIGPDGKIAFSVRGVKGSGCEAIAQAFEALGKVEVRERSAEYYEQDETVSIRARGKA
jgi:hypothetical protein